MSPRVTHRFMVTVSESQLAALDRLAAEARSTRAEVTVACAFGLLAHGRDEDAHAELRQMIETHAHTGAATCSPAWFLNPRHPSLSRALEAPIDWLAEAPLARSA